MEPLPKLSSLTVLLLSLIPLSSGAFAGGVRVELTHVHATAGDSEAKLIQRAVASSRHRLSTFVDRAPLHAGETEYIVDIAIGTPALAFSALVDTGSDLMWTQCPVFDPSKSSTFGSIACNSTLCTALDQHSCNASCHYSYMYTDHSYTEGVLATETFTIGSTSVPSLAFGCGNSNNGVAFTQAAGFVGLGRGKLSLISQMGLTEFSYCLTPLGSRKKSSLLIGSLPNPNATAHPVMSTPISFYYITLNGITVGGTVVDIPSSTFAINRDGSGGMIIDSGTALTYLEYSAYDKVADAFMAQIKNMNTTDQSVFDLDLCYELPPKSTPDTLNLPKLIFHFQGADLELPPGNYFGVDSDTSSICLMMAESSGLSVFGNFMQQNMQVMYDLGNDVLSLYSAECG
ncbi:aspartic proteinase [Musa troglodytarum]|uniref:Aspartic proteinase n=1 Tax=Musa troglodytarum TaxID=320322 RepID=A0A9E7KUD0_9LILI|nr:aspartic proteinase [Musa troglodytarum]